MPYDPNFPSSHADLASPAFRDQFHGLKDLIDAVPGITSAQVDGVTTLDPGQPATVSVSIIGTVLRLAFAIPRGNEGTEGQPGQPGPQGPPFANATIDGVSTLNPGDNATVSVFFDGSTVHFSFGIPRGQTGEPGMQGPMGEVSNATMASAIAAAIAGTSNNTNAVATLDTSFANDPPTLADIEVLRAKVNELILAQRR